jgi:hypothetical protein
MNFGFWIADLFTTKIQIFDFSLNPKSAFQNPQSNLIPFFLPNEIKLHKGFKK